MRDNCADRRFGNYTIIKTIASGGFADVYLGKHIVLDTFATVKVFKSRLSSQRDLSRFLREAQQLTQLQHPHILRVFDFGVEGDLPYMVMPYAPNGSLRQHQPRGTSFPWETIVSYVEQIAQALQYAHNQGVIHRDVKPENLLLHEDGQVLLADFGIPVMQHAQERDVMKPGTCRYMAPEHSEEGHKESDQRALVLQTDKFVEPEEPTYSDQYTLDTMAYMAPERFEGRVTAASDQYALAIVVYEWMTGQTPSFVSPQDSWVNWAQQNQKEQPLDPTALIPREVEQVISKALAKRPDDRYVDVVTFAASLQIAMERSKEKDKDRSYAVAWYKQELEEYERILRDEASFEQERLLEEEKPLAATIECLVRPYMEKALAYLSWVERSCLLLHVDAQFELKEIAEILGIPEESVHEHLENGRRQLLQTYDALLNEEQGISPSQVPASTEEDTFRVERLIWSISQLPSTEPFSSFRAPIHPLQRNEGSRGQSTAPLTGQPEGTGRSLHEGRRLALVVGVNTMAHSYVPDLRYAERDAQEVASMLQRQEGFELITPLLIDKEATYHNVRNSLAHLAVESRATDEVIIHFVGHGALTHKESSTHELSFCTYDWNEPGVVPYNHPSSLSVDALRQLIAEKVLAKRLLIILDCCYADSLVEAEPGKPLHWIRERVAEYFELTEVQSHERTGSLVRIASAASREPIDGPNGGEPFSALFRRVLFRGESTMLDHTHRGVHDLQQVYHYLEQTIT